MITKAKKTIVKSKVKEKDIQSLFSKKINDIRYELDTIFKSEDYSYAFELKICKENRFSFDRVEEHQELALWQVDDSRGVYHKISDSPIFGGMKTRFTSAKPFDCFYIRGIAFVVICWYEPKKLKELHFIQIPKFTYKKREATMKSMTYEESKEISTLTFNLNAKDKK